MSRLFNIVLQLRRKRDNNSLGFGGSVGQEKDTKKCRPPLQLSESHLNRSNLSSRGPMVQGLDCFDSFSCMTCPITVQRVGQPELR